MSKTQPLNLAFEQVLSQIHPEIKNTFNEEQIKAIKKSFHGSDRPLDLRISFPISKVHTLGFWSDGQLQPNICYHPTSTPCEILLKQGYYYCGSEIQRVFPTTQRLSTMKAESFMGVTFSDDSGNLIGSLCIVDQKIITDPNKFEGILKVFAARAAAELQRKRAQAAQHLEWNCR